MTDRVPQGIAEVQRIRDDLRQTRRDLTSLIRGGVDTDQRFDRLIDAESYIDDAIRELGQAIE